MAGNITGEVFKKEIIDQINARQNFLGARYKTDSNIIYGNNVNAFLRLASSINVGTIDQNSLQDQVNASTGSLSADTITHLESYVVVICCTKCAIISSASTLSRDIRWTGKHFK